MNETTMVLLTGLIGTVLVTALSGAALAGAWFLGRMQGQRSAESKHRAASTPQGVMTAADLATFSRAIERLSAEIERVSELQRHSVALPLESRADVRRPEELPRGFEPNITPH